MHSLNRVFLRCHENNSSSLYQWTHSLVENFASRKLGDLITKEENSNIQLLSTPCVTFSPVTTIANEIIFYVYITVLENESIEIWKFSLLDRKYAVQYSGSLQLYGLNKSFKITTDDSGKDVDKVSGDVTSYRLYIYSQTCRSITYVNIPTFHHEYIFSPGLKDTGEIKHPLLHRPEDLSSTSYKNMRKVAILDGISNNIFIFKMNTNNDFVLLHELNNPSFCPFSSICFDTDMNLWASSYEKALLSVYENDHYTPTVFCKIDSRAMTGISYLKSTQCKYLIGCNLKMNRVVAIKSQGYFCSMVDALGPCFVNKPVSVFAIPDCNLLVVAGRKPSSNVPLISFFFLSDVLSDTY